MEVRGKVVIITGGASGIGKALARRFAIDGARHIAIADRNATLANTAAREIGASAHEADVAREADIQRLVADVTAATGGVDLFCSNAGVCTLDPDFNNAASGQNEDWQMSWSVNVMAHVYAARAALPSMIARRSGYFLNVVSAAGLLSQIGATIYSTTKHAAIGFAESLAITHKDDGVGVSVLCPQAVDTAMLRGNVALGALHDGVLTPEDVADCACAGVLAKQFIILPHSKVAAYIRNKASDYDRWIAGMAKLRRTMKDERMVT